MRITSLNIRADATVEMGTGHVMRCIALGQAFQKCGGQVNFFSHCNSKVLVSRIKKEGFQFIELKPTVRDPAALHQMLKKLAAATTQAVAGKKKSAQPWLVLDGYQFQPDFQETVRKSGYRLMVADDYNHLPFYYTDILLNQNVCADTYTYRTAPETRILSGLKYAMIRQEFLQNNTPKESNGKKTNLLVTIGGSDHTNTTVKIIGGLKKLSHRDLHVKIVIGPSNPNTHAIKKAFENQPDFEAILKADMPGLMEWADIAVTAAGSTCLELCRKSVPFITIVIAENQKNIADGFEKTGACINLGWYSLTKETAVADAVDSLLTDTVKRKKMVQVIPGLVDGKGTQRIIHEIEGFGL